jgi:hypothetical protein
MIILMRVTHDYLTTKGIVIDHTSAEIKQTEQEIDYMILP